MNKIVFILALGVFGIITTEFGIIGVMPAIAREFQISIDTAGWLLSGFALVIALTGPFVVLLTSGINRKWMMSLVLLLFVVSNILSAIAPSFGWLMLARLLPAFLHPVFWSVASVAAAKQVAPEDAPKAVAVVLGGLSAGTVLGVPLSTYLAELTNWRISFIVPGIFNVLAFAAISYFIPSMPVREKQSVKSQLTVLRNPQLWVNLFATMLVIAGMFSSYSYLAEYLGKVSVMSGAQISIMLLLFGAAGMAGNWVTGLALSRNVIGTARVSLLLLAVIHLLAFVFGGLFVPMAGIVAFWGFIHASGFLIGQIRTTSEAQGAPELASSLMVSFGNAGVTIGTMAGGFVIAHFGIRYLAWAGVLLFALAFAMTYVCLKKRKGEEEEDALIAEEQEEMSPVLLH